MLSNYEYMTLYVKRLFLLGLLLAPVHVIAQLNNLWHYEVGADVTAAPSNKLPFWFRADQYGSVPLSGTSTSFIAGAYKSYDSTKTHKIDWAFGLQTRANLGNEAYLTLIEGYLKAKTGIFELSAGRTKNITGLIDSTLSSGSFSISGNALGIPQIQLAIPQYYTIPIFDQLFAFKANYAFGIVGDLTIKDNQRATHAETYYQQNSLYVRLGKPAWKLKLFGGINHNVMSGNERSIFGPDFTLSPIQGLIYAAIGKTYIPPAYVINDHELRSKVGNHLGSVDMQLQYDFPRIRLTMYRQNIYDVGAIGHLANIADGINGISITNLSMSDKNFKWYKILFELIYTKNQAGEYNSGRTSSGDEDYYNNYVYLQGWSYGGLNLGNPLLTDRKYTRHDLISDPSDYYINNRVIALHTGVSSSYKNTYFTLKLTYSKNYGTYGSSFEGHNLEYIEAKKPNPYGIFKETNQFSGYLEANRNIKNGFNVGVALAGDDGGLYDNSIGVQLKVKKIFN
jgi:hypothetical protein